MARSCKFTKSPVTFLRIIICLRRKGQSFNSSHLGRILNGELLKEEHFVFQGMPVVPGRITTGNEMFETKEVIDVMEVENKALEVKQEAVEVEETVQTLQAHDAEVEMVGGRGRMMDQNGVIVLDD